MNVGYNDGHQKTITMNGEIPSVPITTLAGISSLTDCKYLLNYLTILLSKNIIYKMFYFSIIKMSIKSYLLFLVLCVQCIILFCLLLHYLIFFKKDCADFVLVVGK